MPIENWDRKRDEITKSAKNKERQWSNGNILGVGPEVDADARYLIKKDEYPQDIPDQKTDKSENTEGSTNSYVEEYE